MKSGFIPNQHGAWAMQIVPFVLGVAAAGPVWLHVPLFLFWLFAYLFSFAFLQGIRTKRWHRQRKPLLLYGAALAAAGLALLAGKPSLLMWVPVFMPLFLVNCLFSHLNQERAFLNDLAAVVQFHLIIFVAVAAADGSDWPAAWTLAACSLLYFVGTIFYVKTIIRERHNPVYYGMSVVYHALLPLAGGLLFRSWLLAAMYALFLLRAVWVPKTGLKVKVSGMMEVGLALLFTICAILGAN